MRLIVVVCVLTGCLARDRASRCEGQGFSTDYDTWDLPDGYGDAHDEGFPGAAGSGVTDDGRMTSYLTTDLDGDARPDLIVTRTGGDLTIGDTDWLVYWGGRGGFKSRFDRYGLPAGYTSATELGFPYGSGAGESEDGRVTSYFLADMDGDGRGDIVVSHVEGANAVSDEAWRVYLGRRGGFDQDALSWSLPAGYGGADGRGFASGSGSGVDSAGLQTAYSLTDMDGDDRPDLLITFHEGSDAIGADHWVLHRNVGDGFGAEEDWALPGDYELRATSGGGKTATDGELGYFLADMDGDDRPDLVISFEEGASTVGREIWRVYYGNDSGFESDAVDWTLPDGYGTDTARAFPAASGSGFTADDQELSYTVTDLDGDRVPDLVITRVDGKTSVGTDSWKLYRGAADGFDGASTDWELPGGFGTSDTRGFPAMGGEATTQGARLAAFFVGDLDGDYLPDLTVTQLDGERQVGREEWHFYEGRCRD